jgi:predicted permease
MFRDVVLRLRALFRGRTVESDLDDELRWHVDQEVQKHLGSGLTRADAERRARLAFGGLDHIKDACRDARGTRLAEVFLQDVRYGWRTLWRRRLFALVAILTLALGIGANTAMFSIVHAVLLRTLPFPGSERLVSIIFSNPAVGSTNLLYSVPELEDLRTRAGVFDDVTGTERGSIDMTGGREAERLEMLTASANYFSMLDATAELGRLFGPEDNTPALAPGVVISDSLWRRDFAADPHVIGRTIHLDVDAHVIIGVLPPDFHHPGVPRTHDIDVWLASGFRSPADPLPTRSGRAFPGAVGRLKAGVTLEQAQTRLAGMAADIRREFPADYPAPSGWTVEITPLHEAIVGKVRPMLYVLQGAVGVIVLIIALNIANLLLARASGRQQEIAVRAALGASRGRIAGQMLTESMLLSFLGGAAGIVVAFLTLDGIVHVMPSTIPRVREIRLDGIVLLFAFLTSLVTGTLFGVTPALHASRGALAAGIRERTGGSGTNASTRRMRDLLIVAELALAVVLTIGAGLLLRTLQDLLTESPGFNPTQIVAAGVNLPFPSDPKNDPYGTLAKQAVLYHQLGDRIRAISGVQDLAFGSQVPATDVGLLFTLSGFAATAVLLASLGIYGVLAFLVGQRTREIGLRMALGASDSDVLTPILSRGLALAATGIAAGALLSAAAVSMIASVLYGVRPHDPIVFATVPVLLLTFAALASYLPARRATKIDPMRALRES